MWLCEVCGVVNVVVCVDMCVCMCACSGGDSNKSGDGGMDVFFGCGGYKTENREENGRAVRGGRVPEFPKIPRVRDMI